MKFRNYLAKFHEIWHLNAMYKRSLPLLDIIKRKSIFLFGARQTGKSTLLRTLFPEAKYYDLLEADTFRELNTHPELIRQRLVDNDKIIIIDEVQKLPSLLDEVHLLIERNKELRFILTGSSARKLHRKGINLLAGRAWRYNLFPLTSFEVGIDRVFELISKGGLPTVLDSPFPKREINEYVGSYLADEIKAEGLTRSVENFSRFLVTAAACNNEQLNFTSIANDAQVPSRTVREYFQILEDTLIGSTLKPFQKTVKRKPVATAKFYFFDVGVANCLAKRLEFEKGSESYGKALEHFIFTELKSYISYKEKDLSLTYWRSQSQLEVDFVIGDNIGIEVKSKMHISPQDCKGLIALNEEVTLKHKIIVCNEKEARRLENGIQILPVEAFLKMLWNDEIIQ